MMDGIEQIKAFREDELSPPTYVTTKLITDQTYPCLSFFFLYPDPDPDPGLGLGGFGEGADRGCDGKW